MSDYINAIEIKDVIKTYNDFKLDNISFELPKGCIMGFIGQNGAGKTTTIRSMLNIAEIDFGEIKLLGLDHIKDEMEIKKRIAVIFDDMPFQESLNAYDMEKIMSGIYPDWNGLLFDRYLDYFGIPMYKKIKHYSKGMKMKLQIVCAFSHHAELIIMDEPTAGLDPIVRDEMLSLFREYMQEGECSILMSSHITSDLEKIADMITFIDKGKIMLSGYKDDILFDHGIIKCSQYDAIMMSKKDIVSKRINSFGAEVMVRDREKMTAKYPAFNIEPVGLDDIMLYYAHEKQKEWS